jgi:hypothetical protein
LTSRPAADARLQLFVSYAARRLRLFLHEILQLDQRFLVAFLYLFGLFLSGNDQLAVRQNLAHLLSPKASTPADFISMACFLLYGWIVAAVVRWSARGGRVHYLAESLPLPFAWERMIRALSLNVVNLILFILSGMGLHQLIQEGGSWPTALLLWAAYYIWIIGLQLSLLEQNWRLFPFWIVGAFLLVLSKGTPMVWPCITLTAVLAIWSLPRRESKVHDHPELPLGTLETRWRSAITRRFPARMMMQIAYTLARPALLIYCSLIAIGLNFVLAMVLKQDIPLSQKIHVYTVITGVISIVTSSFFRNFHLQRREVETWIQSLPQAGSWWQRQDHVFINLLYLLFTVPISFMAILQQQIPAPLPWLVLPIHSLGFFILGIMQRSRHPESHIPFVLGLSAWFILLAYLCDHALQLVLG